MIINTGQRTDIPAFYSEWFVNRLRAGEVLVRSPYDPGTLTRYRLTPDVVDLIGFCTKDPEPMLPHMDLLAPFGQYWYVTVTPYGKDIEPRVPPKTRVLDSFRHLSDRVGSRRVGWRYDPVFISDIWPVERHIRAFEYMAKTLCGYTETAVISFIDLYEKTKRNFPEAREVSPSDRAAFGKAAVDIGRRCGMTIRPCAEGDDLKAFGADCSGCMTVAMYERALGQRLIVPRRPPARKECACYLGGDVGAYNTCGHLCRYCYANWDEETVKANMRRHDPRSPLLIGRPLPGDVIRDAVQESWIDPQTDMLDL
ncbi:MAG: DUF1848 domain-containing protein [Clostridia bacterium]|nr:DUF1848 domain-containing protein [Clostridia bacterium]